MTISEAEAYVASVQHDVSLYILHRIAQAFGVRVCDLIEEIPD